MKQESKSRRSSKERRNLSLESARWVLDPLGPCQTSPEVEEETAKNPKKKQKQKNPFFGQDEKESIKKSISRCQLGHLQRLSDDRGWSYASSSSSS